MQTYNCACCGKVNNFKRGKKEKFCNVECSGKYQSQLTIDKLLKGKLSDVSVRRKNIKNYVLNLQNNKCKICGIEPIWNNKLLIFIMDHIDGSHLNNNLTNLRMICPNCDSQTDTYKAKNKGNGRINRT